MSKADKYLIAVTLFVALLSSFLLYAWSSSQQQRGGAAHAIVKIQGKPALAIDLSDEAASAKYTLKGKIGLAIVEIKGKRIRMLEAPCPDKICIKQGWIHKAGDTIICIPNQIYIFIEDGDTALDAVSK